jgi:hypothetical protein
MRSADWEGLRISWSGSEEAAARTLVDLAAMPKFPGELRRHTSEMIFSSARSAHDAYWETQYGMPGFVSRATGGDGRVVVYNGNWLPARSMAHEMGHNLAKARYGSTAPPPTCDFAAAARQEPPPTDYAAKAIAEDFAESVAIYVTDPAALRSIAPRRSKVIDQIIRDPGYGG